MQQRTDGLPNGIPDVTLPTRQRRRKAHAAGNGGFSLSSSRARVSARFPDWSRIIVDIATAYLEKEGRPLSSYKLGIMIGRNHRTIELIAKGSEPKHSVGEALLALRSKLLEKITEGNSWA